MDGKFDWDYLLEIGNKYNRLLRWRCCEATLPLVIVLFLLARLWHLTANCLWFDEIFSLHAAEHSWRTLLPFAAADLVHPPLFYIHLVRLGPSRTTGSASGRVIVTPHNAICIWRSRRVSSVVRSERCEGWDAQGFGNQEYSGNVRRHGILSAPRLQGHRGELARKYQTNPKSGLRSGPRASTNSSRRWSISYRLVIKSDRFWVKGPRVRTLSWLEWHGRPAREFA